MAEASVAPAGEKTSGIHGNMLSSDTPRCADAKEFDSLKKQVKTLENTIESLVVIIHQLVAKTVPQLDVPQREKCVLILGVRCWACDQTKRRADAKLAGINSLTSELPCKFLLPDLPSGHHALASLDRNPRLSKEFQERTIAESAPIRMPIQTLNIPVLR
jgi:hypothetical protein